MHDAAIACREAGVRAASEKCFDQLHPPSEIWTLRCGYIALSLRSWLKFPASGWVQTSATPSTDSTFGRSTCRSTGNPPGVTVDTPRPCHTPPMHPGQQIPVGDGVSLHVRRLGEPRPGRPPLLAVHGGPSWDHSYLLPGLEPIAARREVVAFDMRGCGRSTRDLPVEAYQPDLVVEDIRRLIDALGHDTVDLLGFSTGGQVAQLFTEAHPERVRRLVLASTTAYGDVSPYLADWPEYERRAAMATEPPADCTDLQWTVHHARTGAVTAIWDLGRLDAYLRLLDGVVFTGDWLAPWRRGLLRPWRPADPAAVLREWGGRVMILHGEQDMGFPLPLAERLHEAVPGSVLAVIPAAGHMAHVENPGLWVRHVRMFLG